MAIVRLNDVDWETWDNRTEFHAIEEWPLSARDLSDAIAALIRSERAAEPRIDQPADNETPQSQAHGA